MALGSGPNIKLATIFYELEARTSGLKKDLQDSESSLGRLSEFIRANPMVAVAALGAAIVGIGAKAVVAAADFESEMAKVNTVANLSKTELGKMADQVGQLFKQYPVADTKTLTDGLYQIISSGISAKDAMKVLDVATRTAIGGFTSTETVVDALTSVMNAYKGENISAGKAADVLAKAVANGKIEMGEIAGSIGQVVGIAATFGTSIEEVSAVLAQLSLGGIKTAEGITGLRSAIVNIIRPADDFKKTFPELSAAFDENRLKRDGFVKFLLDFQKESGGSSDALKLLIRDTQGYNAVVNLLKDGGDGLTKQLEDMRAASGAVDAAFVKVNETANAQYQILKNNLSAAFIDLGERILPLVNSLLSGILGLLERINGEAAKREAAKSIETIADRISKVISVSKDSGTQLQEDFRKVSQEALRVANDIDLGRLKLQDFGKTDLQKLSGQFLALSNSPLVTDYMKNRFERLAQSAANVASRMKDVADETQGAAKPVIEVGTAGKASGEELEKAAKAAAAFAKKISEATKDAAKAAKDAFESYERKQKQLSDKLADAVVQATETMVDDMSLALRRGIEELEALGATEADIAQFRALREGAIKAQQNIEKIADSVKSLGRTQNDVLLLGAAVKRVNELIAEQNAIRLRPGVSDAERVAAERNIVELTGTRTGLESRLAEIKKGSGSQAVRDATTEATETERSLKNAQAKANAITVSAQGAIKLATSFGLVSESTGKALADILTIGAQIPLIVKATTDIISATGQGAATGGAWAALANGLAAVGGVIASAIAEDKKARRERERVTNANTRAVEMLTKVQGDLLRLQLSGRDFSKSRDALSSFLERFSKLGDFREFGKKGLEGIDPARELERLGISFEDIKEIAKTLGITLDGQIGSYRRLLEAIRAADLKGFVNTFSGALEQLETQFEVRAEKFKTPADRLAALIKLLNDPEKGAPALFKAIGDIDVSTVEGQNKAIEEIQKLLDKLDSGDLTPEDLGNLSLQEFKEIIKRLNNEVRGLLEESSKKDTPGTKKDTPEDVPAPDKGATSDALKVFNVALAALKDIPALMKILGDIDVSTKEGQSKFATEVKSILVKLAKGDFTSDDLGGKSNDEIQTLLNKLTSLLDELPTDEKPKDVTPTETKTPVVTSETLETFTAAFEDLIGSLTDLSNTASVTTTRIAEYAEELKKLNEFLSTPLTAPSISSNALGPSVANAIIAALESREPPPVTSAQPVLNLTLHVHFPEKGVVVGNMDQLANDLYEILVSKINTGLGRELTKESFVTGDRRVVTS